MYLPLGLTSYHVFLFLLCLAKSVLNASTWVWVSWFGYNRNTTRSAVACGRHTFVFQRAPGTREQSTHAQSSLMWKARSASAFQLTVQLYSRWFIPCRRCHFAAADIATARQMSRELSHHWCERPEMLAHSNLWLLEDQIHQSGNSTVTPEVMENQQNHYTESAISIPRGIWEIFHM